MPPFRGRRRRFKRRRNYSFSGNTGRYGRTTFGMVPRGMPQQEMKYFDEKETFVLGASGQYNYMHDLVTGGGIHQIATGTGPTQRLGRKIIIHSIHIIGSIRTSSNSNATSVYDPGLFSLTVVLDQQHNSEDLTVAPGIQAAKIWGSVFHTITQRVRNLETLARFKILWSKFMRAKFTARVYDTGGSVVRNGPWHNPFNFYKKCYIPIEFTGVNGLSTENPVNCIYGLIAYHAALAGALPNLEYMCRIRFTDG